MNGLKIKILLSLLSASLWSLAHTLPVRSQPGQSSPTVRTISTQAKDLLIADNLPLKEIAQTDLDLEEFCREFPQNSQCSQTQPNNTDAIPVPEPPPAPPENSSSEVSSSSKSGWAIAPEVSTLGLGGHLVTKIIPAVNARVGINAFGLGLDIEDTDADYEGDLNLFNVSTLLDIHPSRKSGFKLSGGLVFTDNNVEGTATTDETITIGDRQFSGEELGSVDSDIDISSSLSPYVGLGWGNAVSEDKGLGFWFNAGVMFGGSPEVNLTPNISQDVPAEVEAEINAAVEDEEAELEDEIGFFEVYPVVSLGFSYQF